MRRLATSVVLLGLLATTATALPTRVFVKSSGMDTGACPITAPCRSFAYALTQVAASGEVIALDTAGYGTFAVTQSVSVFAAPGVTAFIAVSSGTGITIDTPVSANDVIVLRGLALKGTGGTIGIAFSAGHSLAIENCVLDGFQTEAVMMLRTNESTRPGMRIDHTMIRNNEAGVYIANLGAGLPSVGLTISNSTVRTSNQEGILAGDNSRVVVTDSVLTHNVQAVYAAAGANDSIAEVSVERCTITGNYYGVLSGPGLCQLSRGIALIAHNVITGNVTGVVASCDGVVETMTSAGTSTNTIEANNTDGAPSGVYSAK